MMNQTNLPDQIESFEKGFELAYFITQDRTSAVETMAGALDKLAVQCRRERRRFYWRYNHACQPIRRMSHHELDALQWLILLESEPCERAQELSGDHSQRDMVVRYIKHLVQITTSMSSFYVCVGMNRLLHSYSTSETQTAFELITQRFPGADQYRRAKKMLTSRLTERFGDLLEPVKMRHGEIRFKTLEDQSRWQGLVHECLSMFSPWSTIGCCEQFNLKVDDRPQSCLSDVRGNSAGQDAQEKIYCHMFIEPRCRENLSALLSFSSSEARLALPKFAMKDEIRGNEGNKTQGPRVSKLCEEEKAIIAERLTATTARRRKIHPSSVTVVVDSQESSRFDLTGSGQIQIELAAGARLIEIHGIDNEGDLLLGTHLVSYVDEAFVSSKVVQSFTNGDLGLEISPISDSGDGSRALLTLMFKRRFRVSWEVFTRVWSLIRLKRPPEDTRCRRHSEISGALNFYFFR
jgi:phenylpyruvate tautomerase PptA (4-oxalocrotonate tautomerase family)